MQLKLLDIEKFKKENNCKPVTSTNIFYSDKRNFDPNGLWSEEIFGKIGFKERRQLFGYINLNCFIINPVIFDLVLSVHPDFKKVIYFKENDKFIFDEENKIFIKDEKNGECGITLIKNLIDRYKSFNNFFTKGHTNEKVINFLNNNIRLIFINKILVLPAGIRDLNLFFTRDSQTISEINSIYNNILSLSKQLLIQTDQYLKEIFILSIQNEANKAITWLQNNLKGDNGILRSAVLKKTVDYSARISAISSPEIQLGYIGIPWHTVILIYLPFFINEVIKKENTKVFNQIKEFVNVESLSIDNIKSFVKKIPSLYNSLPQPLIDNLVQIAKKIVVDKYILCKRDPVSSRSSYYSAKITVLDYGRSACVNSLTVTSQKLDFDGDTLALIPLFTKEANDEAKKLCVLNNKQCWTNVSNYQGHNYILTLDSVSTIYAATRN